jgi:molecular chaperone Hsp33
MKTNDYLVRATAFDGRVRAFAINASRVVAELGTRHETHPVVTAAIGRIATGALLFGAMLKDEDHLVSLRIQGDGPAGTLLASANGAGDVRALVSNPRPDVEQVRNGKLNVAGAVGSSGRLTVTRDLGLRQPYMGVVELVSGEIGEDIAHYLLSSEQTPSAVGIGVFVEADGSVEAAGGYLVQILAGLPDADVASLDDRIRSLPHPTTMIRAGVSPEQILARIFDDGFDILDRRDVRFHCPCSPERAERALLLLGDDAIASMIDDARSGVHAELLCEFCRARYTFSPDQLAALRAAPEGGDSQQ